MLFFMFVVTAYLYYVYVIKITSPQQNVESKSNVFILSNPPSSLTTSGLATIASRSDPFNDPYAPPLKNDGIYYPTDFGDVRGNPMNGVSVNMQSRGTSVGYQQVGILNRTNGTSGDMILPLMGRRSMTGRDKWQYYTISNTGNLNTKLPVSLNGKSCTSEYGCDNINNSDVVYVEGYNDTFRATIYENNLFQYIPSLGFPSF
jgi:hypothetical protein